MGLRINNNIAAMNAYRNLSATDSSMSKSLEKLSSGFRINRAADDAAGLSISEGLRAQIGGLKQAVRNAQDGVNVVQTADGALTEVHSILQRMRDLSVQAANGGSQDATAQAAADTEFQQLNNELDRIGNTTAFGGQKLLNGTFGASNSVSGTYAAYSTVTVSATAANNQFTLAATVNGAAQTVTVTLPGAAATAYATPKAYVDALNQGIKNALQAAGGTGNEVTAAADISANGAGFRVTLTGANSFTTSAVGSALAGIGAAASTGSTAGGVFQVGANNNAQEQIQVAISKVDSTSLGTHSLALTTTTGAQAAITALDSAISSVSTTRANLGAFQNRFEHTINNLNVTVQNLTASESQIRDTDMAQEMTNFTRNQILSQAGTAMLAQANQASQGVLQLLRG